MLDYKKTYYNTKSLDELISKMQNADPETDSELNMIIDFVPETPEIESKLDKIVERCNNSHDSLYNWSSEDLINEVTRVRDELTNKASLGVMDKPITPLQRICKHDEITWDFKDVDFDESDAIVHGTCDVCGIQMFMDYVIDRDYNHKHNELERKSMQFDCDALTVIYHCKTCYRDFTHWYHYHFTETAIERLDGDSELDKDGMSEYEKMDYLIDEINENGDPVKQINKFLQMINNTICKAELESILRRVKDNEIKEEEIPENLERIRDENAICECEDCVTEYEEKIEKVIKEYEGIGIQDICEKSELQERQVTLGLEQLALSNKIAFKNTGYTMIGIASN